MSENISNKLQLALVGAPSAPKLFTSLQLALGLCGSQWEKIIVFGSSAKIGQYQHLGGYSTLEINQDASPQRYMELLNICASCGKDVVVFSTLSDEWQNGVNRLLNTSYYEEGLKSNRMFFHFMRNAPAHVIACMDTRNVFLHKNDEGKRRLTTEQIIQQPGIGKQFTSVLRLDNRGEAKVWKDVTGVFETTETFKPLPSHGATLLEWCRSGDPIISLELQQRIQSCATLADLYNLLFECDIDNMDILSAFTKRRMQLDGERKEPVLEVVPGGNL